MTNRRFLRWLLIGLGLTVLLALILGLVALTQWPGHTRRSAAEIKKAVADIKVIPGPVVSESASVVNRNAGVASDRLAARTLESIRLGLGYLKVHQEEDGHFVKGGFAPKASFTALVISAFIKSPFAYKPKDHPFLQKAVDAILAAQRKSGVIYAFPTMTFSNYSTSLSIMALQQTGDPKYKAFIDKAVGYLKNTQHAAKEGDVNGGGFGYNKDSRPDLNNTMTVLEALQQSGIPKDDPAYKAAIQFINNTQNRPESNSQKWAAGDPENKGGFVYRPAESPAGTTTDRTGQKRYASYGTMTYAGLVSFLYAHVDRDDPRVKSAFAWICRHYDLHENVNMKDVGLYYYYRIMAKALAAYGEQYIITPDGKKHDWARDLAKHLTGLQQQDGSWANRNGKYFESDHVLVTAYAVHALSTCYREMRRHGPPAP